MPFDYVARLTSDQATAAAPPSDGRLTDAFMGWWAAYAELLRAEQRDERDPQIAHLQAELESARVALAQERITASRPPHNLLHALTLPT
jgi:multidrug resistance efflux pump